MLFMVYWVIGRVVLLSGDCWYVYFNFLEWFLWIEYLFLRVGELLGSGD